MQVKTVQVEGPGGRMLVNETDLLEYENKGYKVVPEDPDNPTDPLKKHSNPDPNAPPPYNFAKHKNAELIKFAEEAGIKSEGLVRAQLIEALTAAKFDPTPKE